VPFRLETERLVLREWATEDREPFRAIASDPRVMRFISDGQPWSDDQVDAFLTRQREIARGRGTCLAALTERDGGQLIGLAGLQPLGCTGEIEVGWWLTPSRWGHGLATEAGQALLEHGFAVQRLTRIVAITHPDNLRSRAVMERLGMRFERAAKGRALGLRVPEADVVLYAIERRPG
jgi:RimJ/RimL family protein N-acetyltransferase